MSERYMCSEPEPPWLQEFIKKRGVTFVPTTPMPQGMSITPIPHHPEGDTMTHSEQDIERSWIVDELHAVEGFLGLSYYRGDRLRADEMERGRVALEKARAALLAAGYRHTPPTPTPRVDVTDIDDRLDAMNQNGEIEYAAYSELRDLVDSLTLDPVEGEPTS